MIFIIFLSLFLFFSSGMIRKLKLIGKMDGGLKKLDRGNIKEGK